MHSESAVGCEQNWQIDLSPLGPFPLSQVVADFDRKSLALDGQVARAPRARVEAVLLEFQRTVKLND
jgi:hypothetical protein